LEIFLGALAEAIFGILLGYLAQQPKLSGLREKLRGTSPERLALQQALETAYFAFKKEYPSLAASFFDEVYLMKPEVAAELAKILTPNQHPNRRILEDLWVTQFSHEPRVTLEESLDYFLDTLTAEIKSQPLLKPFVDSRALEELYTIAKNSEEQVGLQREIRDLLKEGHPKNIQLLEPIQPRELLRYKIQLPTYVYISYDFTDGEKFACQLYDDLKGCHINAWLDLYDIPPDANWDTEIDRALQSASVVLVILTPESIHSSQVKNEWINALSRNIPVWPLMAIDCEIPLDLRLSALSYIDFRTDYDKGIAILYQRLRDVDADQQNLQAMLSTLEAMQNSAPDPRRFCVRSCLSSIIVC